MSAGVKVAVRGHTDLISAAEVQATHSAEPDCIRLLPHNEAVRFITEALAVLL